MDTASDLRRRRDEAAKIGDHGRALILNDRIKDLKDTLLLAEGRKRALAILAAARAHALAQRSKSWIGVPEPAPDAPVERFDDGREIAALREALRFLVEETKWKSVDRDNMEFEGRVTCYQLDKARAALKGNGEGASDLSGESGDG